MLRYVLPGALALVFVCSLSLAVCALDIGQSAPAFKLMDQFGKVWDSSAIKGNVIVVVAADRDSGRSMEPWMNGLKAKYGSRIVLLGLLDLRGVPGIARGFTRSRIRKETKDPLMLDFDGDVADNYLVNSKNPVVVVIDKGLVVKAVSKSGYSDSALASVTSAIDSAL